MILILPPIRHLRSIIQGEPSEGVHPVGFQDILFTRKM